jgi:hypothetical protein
MVLAVHTGTKVTFVYLAVSPSKRVEMVNKAGV